MDISLKKQHGQSHEVPATNYKFICFIFLCEVLCFKQKKDLKNWHGKPFYFCNDPLRYLQIPYCSFWQCTSHKCPSGDMPHFWRGCSCRDLRLDKEKDFFKLTVHCMSGHISMLHTQFLLQHFLQSVLPWVSVPLVHRQHLLTYHKSSLKSQLNLQQAEIETLNAIISLSPF